MEKCVGSMSEKQSLRKTLYFLQAVLLSLLYFVGNAYLDARFMMLGHRVLAQHLPKTLDPSRTFESTPIDSTYEVTCYGVWLVGIPSLLAATTAVACTLDDCTAEKSFKPAERWLGARVPFSPSVWLAVGSAWAMLAGPMGVWMHARFGSSAIGGARGLDAWHAALAMLAGRMLKASCQYALTNCKRIAQGQQGEAAQEYFALDEVEKGSKS